MTRSQKIYTDHYGLENVSRLRDLTLFSLQPIKVDTCPRRQTENLGKPPTKSRLPRFLAIAYRQYVHPSFHVVRPPVGRSVGRSVLVKLRNGESCSRPVLDFFIENYLFPHPSPSIRMAEIKRQINVSEQMDRTYEQKIRY